MLLDDYLPQFDARERHETIVNASAERTWRALRTADLAGWIGRVLMGIRTLGTVKRRPRRISIDSLIADDSFSLIDERAPHEVVLGLAGPFWQLRCRPWTPTADDFRTPLPPNTALAAWNFTIDTLDANRTRLATETRITCSDPAARRKFRMYWTVVRPGSGLIRRVALRAIKREAEK